MPKKAQKTPTDPLPTAKDQKRWDWHKHPFVVPVVTFLVLFVLSLVAFVGFHGQTIGPSDSRIVHLYMEGKEQVLPTRAPTVGELLKRLNVTVGEHDVVEPAIDAAITDDNFNINVYRAHPVTIIDNGKKTTTMTAQEAPHEIAKQAGVNVYPEDKVVVQAPEDVVKEGIIGEKVVIERATPVNVNLYGNQIPVRTHAKTVKDVLAEKDIKTSEGDTVTPSVDTQLTENTQIFVVRVGKQVATQEEAIPAPTQTVDDPTMVLGTTKVQQEGTPGKKLVTYELELRNGQEASRKLLQEVVATQPVAKIIAKGTKVPIISVGGEKGAILSAAGVSESQQYAADWVITRESHWNLAARNSSGCLGLGQACPGSKLIAACPSWQVDAVCQVQFFTSYANSRYGSWQGAMAAWQVKGWW